MLAPSILDTALPTPPPLHATSLALIDPSFPTVRSRTHAPPPPSIRPSVILATPTPLSASLPTPSSKKDLDALSRKGHFLKGSSAALGLQRVQHLCEALQHFGKRRDARGEGPEVSEEEALARCRALLGRLKKNQKEAKDVSRTVFVSLTLRQELMRVLVASTQWLEGFYKEKA